jgi:hypothetical protein
MRPLPPLAGDLRGSPAAVGSEGVGLAKAADHLSERFNLSQTTLANLKVLGRETTFRRPPTRWVCASQMFGW